MPITDQEREIINELLSGVNKKINTILNARDDVNALLRIHSDINSDSIENTVLNKAKTRMKTAAEELVVLST